ncbi:hypothetical protein D9M68_952630 [compost metagenome]
MKRTSLRKDVGSRLAPENFSGRREPSDLQLPMRNEGAVLLVKVDSETGRRVHLERPDHPDGLETQAHHTVSHSQIEEPVLEDSRVLMYSACTPSVGNHCDGLVVQQDAMNRAGLRPTCELQLKRVAPNVVSRTQ